MKYQAFISYRHSEFSRPHAEALETALKRYAKPLLKSPISIFRDERVLRPGDDLPTEIRKGLRESAFLLYLATAEAAQSNWIADELRIWCDELGRRDKLIIIHIGGTIEADAASGAIVWGKTDALPRMLEPLISGIPIWQDLTWARTPEQRDLLNNEYRKAVNALVARFRGVEPGAMNDQAVLTHRRNIRIRNVVVAAIAGLGLVAAFAWYRAAANARDLARTLSDSDFRAAAVELSGGRQREAYALLARSIRNNAHNRAASDRLIHLLNSRELPVARRIAEPEAGDWTELHASPDGRYAIALSTDGQLRVWTDGREDPWRPSTAAIKEVDSGGHVALAQTADGRLLHIDLERRTVNDFEASLAKVTGFDVADSGSHVALSNDQTLCVGRFVIPFACDFRREGGWSLERGALSSDGASVIAASKGQLQVLGTSSLNKDAMQFEGQSNSLRDAERVFRGPYRTVCRVMADPGGLEEESWTAVDCFGADGKEEFSARFDSAGLRDIDVSEQGGFVLAAVDNDKVHLLKRVSRKPGNESYEIDLPGLEKARAFASGRAFYTLSASRELRFFDTKKGHELGLPLQLDPNRRPRAVPFGDGVLVLMADGSAYRWRARLLAGANELRVTDPLPAWYDAPATPSNSATIRKGDKDGDWVIQRAGVANATIRHPLNMEDHEAEQMAEAIGLWPRAIFAVSSAAPIIVTAAGNDGLVVWNADTGSEIRRVPTAGTHLFAISLFIDSAGQTALVVYANKLRTDRYCYGTGIVAYSRINLSQTKSPVSSALPIGWTVQDVAPDLSELLIARGPDLRIVNSITGNVRLTVSVGTPIIRGAFDSQRRFFAAGTRDGRAYVWDLHTGLPIADRLVFDPDPLDHRGAPCEDDYASKQGRLRFSPDGRYLGLRAEHMTSAVSDSITTPVRWSIGYTRDSSVAVALAQIAESVAGLRFNEDGSSERLPQPDIESLQKLLPRGVSSSLRQLPAWLSKE